MDYKMPKGKKTVSVQTVSLSNIYDGLKVSDFNIGPGPGHNKAHTRKLKAIKFLGIRVCKSSDHHRFLILIRWDMRVVSQSTSTSHKARMYGYLSALGLNYNWKNHFLSERCFKNIGKTSLDKYVDMIHQTSIDYIFKRKKKVYKKLSCTVKYIFF